MESKLRAKRGWEAESFRARGGYESPQHNDVLKVRAIQRKISNLWLTTRARSVVFPSLVSQVFSEISTL